jgi:hypothetical protein
VLYDQPNQPENQHVQPEEKVHEDEKGLYVLQSEVEEAIKEIRDKKATGDDDVPGDVLRLIGEGLMLLIQLINNIMTLESGLRIPFKLQ